jgi:glycosyltransferase involved in cell wall biosynthesis
MDKIRSLETIQKNPEEFPKLLPSLLSDEETSDHFLARCLFLLQKQRYRFSFLDGLPQWIKDIAAVKGLQSACNIMGRLEVALGYRRPTLAVYDHALHFIGGAQKYGCTIAQALQDTFDITMISNKPVTLEFLQQWYKLDLSRCQLQIVPIPFFESRRRQMELIDPAEVNFKGDNPFHIISRLSGDYDFFINNSMLEMVFPMSNVSVFVCHFPERERSRFFHVHEYSEIVYNSLYTAEWIKIKWDLTPDIHFYPPVDMGGAAKADKKESIILSVSRFDPGGNKQQLQMIKAFKALCETHPEEMSGWKLVLAGGSVPGNPYLERVGEYLSRQGDERIQLKINVPEEELRKIYEQGKIFWHFCGLGQKDPARVEHFGMNIVEAMQNFCLPIVFRGGGQPEIVEDGKTGFLFRSEEEMMAATLDVIRHPERFTEMAAKAEEKSRVFHADVFVDKVRAHFYRLLKDYMFEEEEPPMD